MIGTAGAIVGGSLLSGALGARASRRAAQTQADATREGIASQERMFERGLEMQTPFREAGLEAQNMLMRELRAPQQYTPSAGLSAAEIAGSRFAPTAGLSPGELGTQQFNFEADPGYAFRLSEGLKALERSAAARGGLLSGGTGRALQRYGQDLASQEYGNAFQRFQQERAARANLGQMEYGRFADEQARRQALGGMEYGQFAGERSARLLPLMQQVQAGQGLTSSIAGQMANLGAAQAGAAGQIGAAQAAGTMGQANALAGAFGQGFNLYNQYQQNQMLQDYMNRIYGPSAGYAAVNYGPGV